jgi:hypothetical protein
MTAEIADLERDLGIARADAAALRRQLDQQVTYERERIMQEAVRRHATGRTAEQWVMATRRLVTDPPADTMFGQLHVRDARIAPRIVKPTTRGGRYLNGDTREAGPGSHIGLGLCGLPLMADESWVRADHALKHAFNHQQRSGSCECYPLCGMCSYLSGQPTIDAAMEALR